MGGRDARRRLPGGGARPRRGLAGGARAARPARRPSTPRSSRIPSCRRSCMRSTAASCARRPAAISCARRPSCRRAANIHRASTRSASPSPPTPSWTARARPTRSAPAHGRRQSAAGDRRDGAVGHRYAQERGRADRPGARADGGARPKFDSYGRLCGATLIPLAELGRPRIDVVRHPLGHLPGLDAAADAHAAEAAFLAAGADEPDEANFIAKHARAYMAQRGCDLETAALRILLQRRRHLTAPTSTSSSTPAPGTTRTSSPRGGKARTVFSPAASASPTAARASPRSSRRCSNRCSAGADLAYQNLESVEPGRHDRRSVLRQPRRHRQGESAGRGSPPASLGHRRFGLILHRPSDQGRTVVPTLTEHVDCEAVRRNAQSEILRGPAGTRYEGVRQDRRLRLPTRCVSGPTGQVQELGLPAPHSSLRARRDDARAHGRAQSEGFRGRWPTASSRAHERGYGRQTPPPSQRSRRGRGLEDRLEALPKEPPRDRLVTIRGLYPGALFRISAVVRRL